MEEENEPWCLSSKHARPSLPLLAVWLDLLLLLLLLPLLAVWLDLLLLLLL